MTKPCRHPKGKHLKMPVTWEDRPFEAWCSECGALEQWNDDGETTVPSNS